MPPTSPEGFRYYTPMTIRYGDMDTLGHVNNAKYLTYTEQARIAYFHERGIWDGSVSRLGVIVAHISIAYKAPLTMQDGTIDLWTRVSRLGTKSFDIETLVMAQRDGQPLLAASATTVMVVFDYTANSSVALPDSWRAIFMDYEPALG
jgi:acyl-CoA thioester hydrolase